MVTTSEVGEASHPARVTYPGLIRRHGRFLGFGLSLTFLSSFGQTYFISLFNDSIRAEFGLSHGSIGGTYSLATLASGFTLAWVGGRLDSSDLRKFTAVLCAALAAAAFGMAFTAGIVSLLLVFFLLRLTGQGLLSHTALTSMARYFEGGRGKAMSIAGIGFPLGEAILPLLTVAAIATLGWRETWLVVAGFLLLVALPGTQVLLLGHGERERRFRARLAEATDPGRMEPESAPRNATPRQWTLGEVVRDRRFGLILPAVVAPGFIVTGFFFHQNHLVAVKEWTPEWFATCFALFAAGQLVTGVASGPLVDRYGGRRLLALFTLPMGMGLTLLAAWSPAWVAAGFMLGLGITAGLGPTVVGAMWAEVYGVVHLGSIRALAQSVMVFGTAASPVLMGVLIDRGVTMDAMAWGGVAWVTLAAALAWASGVGKATRQPAPGV
ncbi:MAG: MFS transporter [Gemmatimonadetes bacterium]|nr:MFS transporter [Gemmatimonadota bacterium]